MRSSLVRFACASILLLSAAAGCESPGVRFLSFIALQKNPLVLALVSETPTGLQNPLQLLNPFGPYVGLQEALGAELNRGVAMDLCLPIQLQPCLETGLYHAAVVSPAQYANLSQPQRFQVIAVPTDANGQLARSAVLVAPAASPIHSIEELRGKIVAFGPASDSRTHQAALDLLAQHGLRKDDLSLELLPLPGSLKHMPDSREVALTVINGSSDAGFLDERDWQSWPELATQPGEPARNKLRILGRTAALPDRLIIASPKLEAATIDRMRAFLLNVNDTHPAALRPLHVARYEPPSDELVAACLNLAQIDRAGAAPPSPAACLPKP